MNRTRLRAASAVLAAVVASGCVSKGAYEKLGAEKNQEIDALQRQHGGLQEQVQSLQKQKTSLEQRISALEQQKTHLLAICR
jgi:peptidoglycan hydrolase CwlO-like protein